MKISGFIIKNQIFIITSSIKDNFFYKLRSSVSVPLIFESNRISISIYENIISEKIFLSLFWIFRSSRTEEIYSWGHIDDISDCLYKDHIANSKDIIHISMRNTDWQKRLIIRTRWSNRIIEIWIIFYESSDKWYSKNLNSIFKDHDGKIYIYIYIFILERFDDDDKINHQIFDHGRILNILVICVMR